MPFMSVTEFEKRTSILFTTRGDKLKAIAQKLQAYNQASTIDNLDELRQALNRWKTAHNPTGTADGWKQDRRNTVKDQKSPIEELDAAVTRQYREEARLALAAAVRTLDSAYATDMKPEYREALIDTFHNTFPSNTLPLTCYVWYRPNLQNGQRMWSAYLKEAGATDVQGKTDGLTVPLDGSDLATANAWLDTNRKPADLAVVGRYVTAGNQAPRNRVISTSDLEAHTLVHEMLHWVTHHDFREYTYTAIKDAQLAKFIREGLTEWLTRKGMNEWNKGGYGDLVPHWQNIMSSNALSFADVKVAFFQGRDVSGFCKEVERVVAANKGYQAWLQQAQAEQLKKWLN
jgi:hypothetical protein